MLKQITTFATLCLASLATTAQTISDFETPLSQAETSYLEGFTTDGTYPFTSGNLTLEGKIDFGGTYQSGFSYSNRTDDTTGDWTNMWSAITAGGYQSEQYMIAYLEGDYTNSNGSKTIVYPGVLSGAARQNYITGMYVTNTTYAYHWIKENYVAGNYFKLVIKGYNSQSVTDSITVTLAEIANNDTTLINDWQWVDLTALGKVDSITFQMQTNNLMTPTYFAMDNFTTSDGICEPVDSLSITNISGNSAQLNWQTVYNQFNNAVLVAIDTTDALEPHSTTIQTTVTDSLHFVFENLLPNTNYTAHIKSVCDSSNAEWQKINFTTTGLSINSNLAKAISLYPNPTTGIINLKNADAWQEANIYTIHGQLVKKLNLDNGTLDIADLPANAYILEVVDADNNKSNIIIQKL